MFTLALIILQKRQSYISASLDFSAPPYRTASWQQHPGDVLSRRLASGLSVKTYCNSVTQQERNYFRQLWFDYYDLRVNNQYPTCLLTSSTRCQNQSAPVEL